MPENSPPLELAENSTGNSFRFLRHGIPWEFVKWHFHPEYELHQIVKTSGKLFIGDSVYSFYPGSLFLVGSYIPHNFVSNAPPDAVIPGRDLVVQFRKEWIEACEQTMVEFQNLRTVFEEAVFGVEYKDETPQLVFKILNRMDELSATERLSAFISVLDHLARCKNKHVLGRTTYFIDRRTASLRRFNKVVDFIRMHIEDDIRLEQAADHVHMSYKAFSKWFAECAGIGFRRFVIKARINKSCEYLYANNQSIQEICFRVGFNNVSNYNRLFHQILGVTPTEFRRKSMEKRNINYLRETCAQA